MGAVVAAIFLSLTLLWISVVAEQADKRGRSVWAWGIAGLFLGLFALMALLVAGDTDQERLRKATVNEPARL